jgi:hypothetical protein
MNGLRQCYNTTVQSNGGSANRPGTDFSAFVKDQSKTVRLVPFIFNNDEALLIEFGDEYIRFHLDGAPITETAKVITGITKANPGVVTTSVAHSYENGDWVYIASVQGMTEVNGRFFVVTNKTASTFELYDIYGAAVNSTGYGTYTSAGTSARVYELDSTYLEDELMDLQFTQSADVITIAHRSHPPAQLRRTSNTSWALNDITFSTATIAGPQGTATAPAAGAKTWRYKITSVRNDTLEESEPNTEEVRTITNGTAANPVVFTTSTNHGFAVGDSVYLSKSLEWASGSIPYPAYYTVSAVGSTTTFSIAYNTTGFGAWVGFGGTAFARRDVVTVHSAPVRSALSPTSAVSITWAVVTDAKEYNVYLENNGIYGYLGVAAPLGGASTVTFLDVGLEPDLVDTLPTDRDIFNDTDKYPGVIGFFQQRQGYANSNDEPEQIWLSKTGFYKKFTYRSPAADDDSIAFTIAGKQVNEVRHLLDLGNLVILTSGGEWAALGDSNGVLTPSGINPKQYAYHGASKIPPIVVGNNALYVQARGSIVRDLTFDFQIDGYKGNDLTVFSKHLFEGHTIVDWAFQQVPNSIVWIVRDDGILLGLTYVKDQDILAWHRHEISGGYVENVCVIPEGDEDSLYLVVRRTIDGQTRRYIERLNRRFIDPDAVEDCIFMDSSKTFDGRNTSGTTMTISGGTTWDAHETMTMTASAAFFTSADVGNEIHFTDSVGELIFRFNIVAYTSTTVVTGTVDRLVPVSSRSAATTSWTRAVDSLTLLDHLEGEAVSVFADGFVEASPYNPTYGDPLIVTDGAITLSQCYGYIHVGLPYFSDIETLDIDTVQSETMVDKYKQIGKVSLHLEKTRGVWVGPKPPTDDDTDALENLTEARLRELEGYDDPTELMTGVVTIALLPEWNSNGRIFIRQVDPLPISVLAIAPSGLIPVRK